MYMREYFKRYTKCHIYWRLVQQMLNKHVLQFFQIFKYSHDFILKVSLTHFLTLLFFIMLLLVEINPEYLLKREKGREKERDTEREWEKGRETERKRARKKKKENKEKIKNNTFNLNFWMFITSWGFWWHMQTISNNKRPLLFCCNFLTITAPSVFFVCEPQNFLLLEPA